MNKHNHIIIFDDSCVLCNTAVHFIFKYSQNNCIYFTSFASEYFKNNLSHLVEYPNNESVVFIESKNVFYRSEAVFEISKHLRQPIKSLRYFKFVPRFISDSIYSFIAKYRYTIFGRTTECKFSPELKKMVLD